MSTHLINVLIVSFKVRNCFAIICLKLSASSCGVKNVFSIRTLLDDDLSATELVGQVAHYHPHHLHVCLVRMNMQSSASRQAINHRVASIVEFGNVSPNILFQHKLTSRMEHREVSKIQYHVLKDD